MKFGLVLFSSDRGIAPAPAARAAEQYGFDSFYVPEHTHIPVKREAVHPGTGTTELPDDRYARTLDPWVSLGAASAVTERIRLGTAVAIPVEHDPITLAKTLATLDHLTGGRVNFGVGFGWNIDELADHGVPPKRRRTMLHEYLSAIQALWSQEQAEFSGQFVNFGPSWAWPKQVQQPRIPISLGAAGTDKNFAWIVDHADGWITTPRERDIDDRVTRLRTMWRDAERVGEPAIAVLDVRPDHEKLARWNDIGVTEVIYGMPDKSEADVVAYIERLAGKLKQSAALRQ
ncbi:MAG: LLM class F420-dependent oxidoreductase [Rhodococcus sp. (in: high G+C Gram-positive bacteria)]